jgi:hypothetical protein
MQCAYYPRVLRDTMRFAAVTLAIIRPGCFKSMIMLLSGLSVLFSLLAAVLWAWSSLLNLPLIGSDLDLEALDPFYAALKKVARLNAFAAACAFVSAFLQAFVLYLTR